MKKNSSNEFNNLLNNQCSPTELDEFLIQISDDHYKKIYLELISKTLAQDIGDYDVDHLVKQRLDRRLQLILINEKGAKAPHTGKQINFKLYYKYAAAALVFLILSVGLIYYIQTSGNRSETHLTANIKPGGNKAVLTLSDGSRILLTDAKNGELASQSGIKIVKTRDGQLVYHISGEQSSENTASTMKYNKLETPRGGQYQVNLPDGTKVWLNAESSLTFPPTFAGLTERSIELEGEAYFEVAKDQNKPFKVLAASGAGLKQEVRVLGTHFNINSYKDESTTKTTLLEGSVIVAASGKTRNLKPGQQSILSSAEIHVKEVDVQEIVAWKNGFFIFENDNLEGILKKLARWYDVEVSYNGNLNNVKVMGSVSRNMELSDVLRILEKTDKFKFKLEGRRISVMP
ncbi:FecR family protein [Pedobacter frigoris]|uniref:FecR family protein n=1 Tax=Pedobacter frigoris TaxID=2571272 RepID=UPI00292FB9FB|nr:FecR domain-containing protein [Pedobacter frigoris]